ncbi:hypothetical protein Hanom_Chr01g00027331 [Helianthus anomalus]
MISHPKSFHDWKMKFFFIREEVMPIAMIFRESDKIEKEELPIPKTADWYIHLLATPNRIFGEQVLVATGIVTPRVTKVKVKVKVEVKGRKDY